VSSILVKHDHASDQPDKYGSVRPAAESRGNFVHYAGLCSVSGFQLYVGFIGVEVCAPNRQNE